MEIKVIKICKDEETAKDIDDLMKTNINKSTRRTYNRNGYFIRNAYLIYMMDMTKEKDR